MSLNMHFDAVLIDLDGTLLDTIADIAAATNAMRSDLGLSALPVDEIQRYVGKGSEWLVKRALADQTPDEQAAQLPLALASFYEHYRQLNGEQARPYPGVVSGLEAFKQAGLKLTVVTNKLTEFTKPVLNKCNLDVYFDLIVCGDTCAQKKPDPMPLVHACQVLGATAERCLFIGDSVNDVQAARSAGMPVVVVPYGYNEGKDVQTLDADAIVSSIAHAAQWAAQPKQDAHT